MEKLSLAGTEKKESFIINNLIKVKFHFHSALIAITSIHLIFKATLTLSTDNQNFLERESKNKIRMETESTVKDGSLIKMVISLHEILLMLFLIKSNLSTKTFLGCIIMTGKDLLYRM